MELEQEFWEALRAGSPFPADQERLRPLLPELVSVLEELAATLRRNPGDPLVGEEHGELLARLRAVAHRVAVAGVSPTAFASLVPAIDSAIAQVSSGGQGVSRLALRSLATVSTEGYVAGFRDEMDVEHQSRIAAAWAPRILVPRLVLFPVSGRVEAEPMLEAVDALGRFMLRADAAWTIVDAREASCASVDASRALLSADTAGRILGASTVFVGVGAEIDSVARSGVDVSLLRTCADLKAALELTLPAVGYSLRSNSWIPGLLRPGSGNGGSAGPKEG